MVYNIFTHEPLWGWILLGSLQTLVIIPVLIYYFGKGAYCGWICSCGALAETLGDTHRHKMPHGPRWNRLNMLGQGILGLAVVMLLVRIAGWIWAARRAASGQLQMVRRCVSGWCAGLRSLFLVQRSHMVSLCVPARGVDAHLCTFLPLPHPG